MFMFQRPVVHISGRQMKKEFVLENAASQSRSDLMFI